MRRTPPPPPPVKVPEHLTLHKAIQTAMQFLRHDHERFRTGLYCVQVDDQPVSRAALSAYFGRILADSTLIATPQQGTCAPAQPTMQAVLPRAAGVARDLDSPGEKGISLYFDRRLSDDEMRFLHDLLGSGSHLNELLASLTALLNDPAVISAAKPGDIGRALCAVRGI